MRRIVRSNSNHRLGLALLVCAVVATGCGGGDVGDAPLDTVTSASSGDTSGPATGGVDLDSLPTTPIAFTTLFEAGGSDFGPDSCRFLAADTVTAATAGSASVRLQSATDTSCAFTADVGSLSLQVGGDDSELRASAFDPPYTLDAEVVTEPASGPGEGAALYFDPPIDGLRDKPLGFSFGFVDDGRVVVLRMSGLAFTNDGWRTMADEVASKLDDAEVAAASEAAANAKAPPCSWYSPDDVASFLGESVEDVEIEFVEGLTRCKFLVSGIQVFGIVASTNQQFTFQEQLDAGGFTDRRDDLGALILFSPDQVLGYVDETSTTAISINGQGEPAVLEAVLVNLLSRVESP